ncbi:MAG: ferritin [Rubritalea sp.]|jgi:ferritin|tara:strand:+ start:592 stop:1095 length:504 start_codon:yes stop_codon:yes gene_type:complete
MIKEQLINAINAQICQELTASYSYLGMSTYFDELSLDGFSGWMQNQHSEEHEHAMKLLNYLQDRGGRVQLASIPSPQIEFSSILEVFEISLQMEIENTSSINKLYELATEQNDHATKSHLQWFLDEQVEEEKSMEDIIANLKLIGDDKAGLLYLNDKLGNRTSESAD